MMKNRSKEFDIGFDFLPANNNCYPEIYIYIYFVYEEFLIKNYKITLNINKILIFNKINLNFIFLVKTLTKNVNIIFLLIFNNFLIIIFFIIKFIFRIYRNFKKYLHKWNIKKAYRQPINNGGKLNIGSLFGSNKENHF